MSKAFPQEFLFISEIISGGALKEVVIVYYLGTNLLSLIL